MPRFFQRRVALVPTLWGWLLLALLVAAPAAWWCFHGEAFLSVTSREPTDVLVVEAWMREDGAHAAFAEFHRPGARYRYIVATGGLTGEAWYRQRWNEVEIVRRALLREGLPPAAFVAADAPDANRERTFAYALAAKGALARAGLHPAAINVLTEGAHARRSRLVFQRAFGPRTRVGVIAWIPPGYGTGHWWDSSDRAIDFLKETAGYFYELLLYSGRPFQHTRHAAGAAGHASMR